MSDTAVVPTKMGYHTSEQVQELFTALNGAQKIMAGATKDALNPHFGNKYADLASIWDACRSALTENGLSVFQPVNADGPRVTVTTLLAHKSGQWISSDLTLTSDKNTPQGIGSAITYGRRYGLSAMIGIAPEDDDGNLASGSHPKGSKEAAKQVSDKKLAQFREPSRGMMPDGTQEPIRPKHADGGSGSTEEFKKAAEKAAENKDYEMREHFASMKKILGEPIYYGVLRVFGFTKSSFITTREKGREVFTAMKQAAVAVNAAKHGEVVPGMNESVFDCLPVSSRDECFRLINERLKAACGDDVAAEVYQEAQEAKQAEGQWALYQELKKQLEKLIEQQTA